MTNKNYLLFNNLEALCLKHFIDIFDEKQYRVGNTYSNILTILIINLKKPKETPIQIHVGCLCFYVFHVITKLF